MIKFILNNKVITTELPSASLLLDFVRYQRQLTGTKIGCREGDCGACTVLIGKLKENRVMYRSFTSCLTPLGNVYGKHVVTIEGINLKGLNPIQQAMQDASATQCGFCTPGFVMSLAGFCLSEKEPTTENAIAAIDGNICRCTGYKSIEKAATQVASLLEKGQGKDRLQYVANNNIMPLYFADIKKRLSDLSLQLNRHSNHTNIGASFIGGGTDLYVQKHDEMTKATVQLLFDKKELNGVYQDGDKCIIGPSATVTDLSESGVFKKYFPHFSRQVKLISSTPIRNMATIAGNFVNASPIGDFTIFFLALDAMLVLTDGTETRELALRQFYKSYKTLDKKPAEYIERIWFKLPKDGMLFNFEKVSKRTHLDIASVNSAIAISIDDGVVNEVHISAGGVGPTPKYLELTSRFLKEKTLSEDLVAEAIEVAQTEISPISDARGTEAYKRLLLAQLIKAHFITLFSDLKVERLMLL